MTSAWRWHWTLGVATCVCLWWFHGHVHEYRCPCFDAHHLWSLYLVWKCVQIDFLRRIVIFSLGTLRFYTVTADHTGLRMWTFLYSDRVVTESMFLLWGPRKWWWSTCSTIFLIYLTALVGFSAEQWPLWHGLHWNDWGQSCGRWCPRLQVKTMRVSE